jgi:hypothetical protein
MFVNYHAINNIMVKYRHSIPRIDDISDKLYRSYVFPKINLKSRYHKIKMKDGDE